MAASISAFFQTLVTGVTEASRQLAPTFAAHKAIYWDYNPKETGALGQTLNIPIPVNMASQVTDIGAGDLLLTDPNFTTVPIVFDQHPSFAYPVRDFDQFRSADQIRQVFADAALKNVKQFINNKVAQLFTTTNFTTNTAVSCTGGAVTMTQFTGAQATLADQYVPIHDNVENMFVLLPSVPYTKMTDPTTGGAGAAWAQAFIAGNRYAEELRTTGKPPVANATQFHLDQQMPTTGASPSRTFTGAYFHRYAVAGVSRALPPPPEGTSGTMCTYLDWDGLSLRVMLSYSHYPKMAAIMSIDAGYGLKVVRENMGVLFSIAE